MARVDLVGLRKAWGDVVVLEELDLAIEDGEFLVLLGPSGCGKTTTMRLVAGLEDPTAGEIRIEGARVNDVPARRRDLAMVFQGYALYPHMTVGDNIGFPLRLARVPRAERQARVAEAARKVEMTHLLTRRPAELSGGQRQRVALARAMVRRPQAFLMDEPLSNLDAKLRATMRAELKHLQNELGVTTLYVTHDQVEAMTLADRIVILDKGRVQQMGTPAEIYARPANVFVAGFVGSPPMNLIPGVVEGDHFVFPAGDLPVPGAPQGPAILGVRPEDLQIVDDSADMLGEVFASELLGDSTLVSVDVAGVRVAAKVGPRDGRAIGARVGLRLPAEDRLHHFHGWGERMGG